MNLVVVGPGTIGCLFAGLMAEAGYGVQLLDKRAERADHISKHGVRIEDAGGTRTIPVRNTTDAGGIGPADAVFICVKAYDTHSAIKTVLPALRERTVVVSMQNGLGNLDEMSAIVHPDRLLAATTTAGATYLGPGHIRYAGAGATTLAAVTPAGRPHASRMADILIGASIIASTAQDINAMLWSKLVINAAICPVSVVSGLTNDRILQSPKWSRLLFQAAGEAFAVAISKRIRLLYENPSQAVRDICANTAGNLSSMLQDYRRGKKTEIEAINGVIVREAAARGLPAPVNEQLYRQVLDMTAGR